MASCWGMHKWSLSQAPSERSNNIRARLSAARCPNVAGRTRSGFARQGCGKVASELFNLAGRRGRPSRGSRSFKTTERYRNSNRILYLSGYSAQSSALSSQHSWVAHAREPHPAGRPHRYPGTAAVCRSESVVERSVSRARLPMATVQAMSSPQAPWQEQQKQPLAVLRAREACCE